ncbi:MAG: SurA N-terminal domain-containing protein [Parvularculaceae bacterium]
MLKQIRDSVKNIVFLFVMALIVLAFAAGEVPGLRNFAQPAALTVGDARFTRVDVENEFNRQITSRRVQSGGDFDRSQAIAEGLPLQIVQDMATRSALQQAARDIGLAMPRDVVRETLSSDPRFQNPRSGEFDLEALDGILRQYNLTAPEFERIMREDLLRGQLVDAAAAGPGAPPSIAAASLLREAERRDVAYVTVTEDMAGIPEEPTPDGLRQYYEENAALFTAPEQRRFTAVVLREADFRDGLETPEEELRRLYELNKARLYEQPEKRTLYQTNFDAEADAAAAAASLREGEEFEAIAERRGLSLDAVTFTDVSKADILDPAVADAAFEAQPDAVVGPIKGLFGFTVLQIVDVTAPETQTFEDVREEIEGELLANDARKKLFEAVEAIEEARDTGATLVEAAEQAGLAVETYGPIDRFSFGPGGEIVDGVPGEVIAEAFALEEGAESVERELAEKAGYFFVAVDEVVPPAVKDFEIVEPEVERRWRTKERDGRIADAVGQIRQTIADGGTIEDAASPFDRAPIRETIDRRPDELGVLSPSLVERTFSAAKGDVVSGPAGDSGAQTVLLVEDVSYDAADGAAARLAALSQFVALQVDQELLDAYAVSLRQDLGVTVKTETIAEIFDDGR